MSVDTDRVMAAADAVRQEWSARPRVGLILGSGLGALTKQVEIDARLPYCDLPHFPRSTAPGHRGMLVCGSLAGVPIVSMDGRFHCYEGYSPAQVSFPVRVMAALGVELLVVSNACGGMNPYFRSGDLVVIEDHINFTFGNPLFGQRCQDPDQAPPDMSRAYNADLADRALAIARRRDIVAHRGVYLGVMGPNYETRAEYRMFRRLGADVVGMSSVHEVIVARQCGLRVLGLSVVTNVCFPDHLQPASGSAVVAMAASAEPNLRMIVGSIIAEEARQRQPVLA